MIGERHLEQTIDNHVFYCVRSAVVAVNNVPTLGG